MRRLTIGTAIAVLSLIMASVALAAFSQTAKITLTANKAGQSTGIKSDVHASDPTALGQKPKAASKLVITFPAGTKFNLGSVKRCTLTDKQLKTTFGPSCPAASKIGSGTAVANASPLAPTVKAKVSAYVGGAKQMIMVVNHASVAGAPTIVLRASVSGAKLTIPVGVPALAGISVVLTSLKLNVPKHGTGKHALITAGKCAAHKFAVKTHFVYADHSTLDLQSSSRCS